MAKRGKSSQEKIKYHVRHKSKLILLLIVKSFLVFLISIFVLGGIYSVLKDVLDIIFVFIISFVIASVVYLFLIIKVLGLFKFWWKMNARQHRKFRKDMKSHTRFCYKCGLPKRGTCKQSSCDAKHCACRMTDPDIKD